MNVNILLIIIAVIIAIGVGLLVSGKNSKNKRMTGFAIAGVIAVVGILPLLFVSIGTQFPWLTQEINFGGNTVAIYSQPSQITQTTPSGLCAVEDTTVTLSAFNKYTSASTSGTHKYRINGAPALTVSDAGTFTASPNDAISILWMNESNGYYGDVSNEVVPCSGTKTFSQSLIQNGTQTIEVYNEESNLIDGTSNNETLSAGDVVSLESKIKGTYQKGMPYGGVLVVEYNKTLVDDVVVDFGGSKVNVPVTYAITLSTESVTKAYSIPALLSNQILSGSITIDADDTNDPTDSDVLLKLYVNDYFVNENNGGAFEGPAVTDENDASVHENVEEFTLHMS